VGEPAGICRSAGGPFSLEAGTWRRDSGGNYLRAGGMGGGRRASSGVARPMLLGYRKLPDGWRRKLERLGNY